MTGLIVAGAVVGLAVVVVGLGVVVVAIRSEDRHRVPLGARPAPTRLTTTVRSLLGLYVHVHIDEECDPCCPLFAHNRQAKITEWKRGGDHS